MVDLGRFELRAIRREGARVFVEILAGTELQPVDEDRREDDIGMFPRLGHQRDMAGVQIAHRRHHRHFAPRVANVVAERRARRPQAGDRGVNLHQ
jgi:hypothetical protein